MKRKTELQELRNKNKKDLFKELGDSEVKLSKLQFSLPFRKLKNIHEITMAKKRIARIWTILREETSQELQRKENDQK